MKSSYLAAILILALPVLASAGTQDARGAEQEASSAIPIYDCGTMALYTLLRLEGHSTNLKRLESILPQPNPSGYSMQELQAAALAGGLTLEGVLLKKDRRAIDRPMILFLRQSPHGHFVVVRPVGKTGKLVQILDPNLPPDVADASELLESRAWTGLALRPRRVSWPAVVGWTLGISSATLAAGGLLLHWRSASKRLAPIPA